MLQVTAEFIDRTGAPVVNIDFAVTLAKGAGFTLVPGRDEIRPSGQWDVLAPLALIQSIDDDKQAVGIPVSFPNTELTIGLVTIYPTAIPHLPALIS